MTKVTQLNSILVVTVLIISLFFSNYFLPSEDAAILFRYSENLSSTGSISYNLNGIRSEGATDFLWMIILSFFKKLGFEIYFVSIFLNLLSLIISSNLLVKHFQLEKRFTIIFILAHLPFGFFWASMFGFSTLFVELILICLLINIAKNKYRNILFYSFLGTLIRPDFILFCSLINIYYLFKINKVNQLILLFIYIILGVSYFLFRFHYFDLLFPLPYYVKSQWIFLENLGWLKQIILFFPIILFLILEKIQFNLKKILLLISFILVPSIYYANQILYQNIGQRFYFYFFPFFLFFIFYSFTNNINEKMKKIYKAIAVSCIISLCLNIYHERDVFPFNYKFNSKNFIIKKNSKIHELSKNLKNYNNEIKLATTEAGLLPYLTKINTVDLFGLNTPMFAKNPAGGKFLNENNFDLIIINTGQEETNCKGLAKILNKSKKIKMVQKQERNVNWDTFTLQLFSGINLNKYKVVLYPYYTYESNTYIFININSNVFNKLNNFLLKEGIICS